MQEYANIKCPDFKSGKNQSTHPKEGSSMFDLQLIKNNANAYFPSIAFFTIALIPYGSGSTINGVAFTVLGLVFFVSSLVLSSIQAISENPGSIFQGWTIVTRFPIREDATWQRKKHLERMRMVSGISLGVVALFFPILVFGLEKLGPYIYAATFVMMSITVMAMLFAPRKAR
jgi:hypothetical protein